MKYSGEAVTEVLLLRVQSIQVEGKSGCGQCSLLYDIKEDTFPSANGILFRLITCTECGRLGLNLWKNKSLPWGLGEDQVQSAMVFHNIMWFFSADELPCFIPNNFDLS